MARRKVKPLRPVTSFAAYFEARTTTRELVESLGCTLSIVDLALPRYAGPVSWAAVLASELTQLLPRLSIATEIGRREFLIAPVLARLGLHTETSIASEYYVDAGAALRGNLDYLVSGRQNLIVIEAKLGDLERGFRQLAAQMVALDLQTNREVEHVFGAITVGDVWRFAVLNRTSRVIRQDTNLFRVPADLEDLARVLVAILEGAQENEVG